MDIRGKYWILAFTPKVTGPRAQISMGCAGMSTKPGLGPQLERCLSFDAKATE